MSTLPMLLMENDMLYGDRDTVIFLQFHSSFLDLVTTDL